jgi:hypothetical protein
MDTLIELYDKEPIENVLGLLMLKPKRVVFLGDKRAMTETKQQNLLRFVKQLGLSSQLFFYHYLSSDFEQITRTFSQVTNRFPDCAFEVTGGKEIPLLAAGAFCSQKNIPVYYFDFRQKTFLNVLQKHGFIPPIHHPVLSVQNIVTLAGGSFARHGHFSKEEDTPQMRQAILAVWDIYLRYRQEWNAQVLYFQQLSSSDNTLQISAPLILKSSGQIKAHCNPRIMKELEQCGIIKNLTWNQQKISYEYENDLLRRYLCDAGIWLELYTYLSAQQLHYFSDVQTSVVVDWDGTEKESYNTINEIDVLLIDKLTPIFISCKTGVPSTYALNEISMLSKLFGGTLAKAVLITTSPVSQLAPSTCKRANDMGVILLEEQDVCSENFPYLLIKIAQGKFKPRIPE